MEGARLDDPSVGHSSPGSGPRTPGVKAAQKEGRHVTAKQPGSVRQPPGTGAGESQGWESPGSGRQGQEEGLRAIKH